LALNSKIGRTTDFFTSTQGHPLLQETPAIPNAYYDILLVLGRFNDISLGRQCSAPLPFFADRNVAILGDAVGICFFSATYRTPDHERKKKRQAHAMTPFQGAGAGQAIEVSLSVPCATSGGVI